MTIGKAIETASRMRESDIPEERMIYWLSSLDGQIVDDVIRQHIGGTSIETPDYGAETDPATELLIGKPWDEVYVYYLAMRVDMEQGETELAKLDNSLYTQLYQQWLNHYTRTHRARSVPFLRF